MTWRVNVGGAFAAWLLCMAWSPTAWASAGDSAAVSRSLTSGWSMPGREWRALPVTAEPTFSLGEPLVVVEWSGAFAKRASTPGERRFQVGEERLAPKSAPPLVWLPVAGGWAARVRLSAEGAQGLRARIDLRGAPFLELRAASLGGRVTAQAVQSGEGSVWGPWTGGGAQELEVFALARPAEGSVRVGAIIHFDVSPEAKASGSCNVDVTCSSGTSALDAAIAERAKSVARLTFVDDGRAFLCSGTLIDSGQFPTPYFLTANHCITRRAVADSITAYWFYENASCGAGPMRPEMVQVAGGMDWVFADPNTDHTLLKLRGAPPSGAVFAGWNASPLATNDSIVSISHPRGDVKKLALGTISGTARFRDWEQSAWLARFSRGIIEGGSSGSGLFTLANGKLALRAVLSASTTDDQGALSCTNLDQQAVYNRLDVFLPQVANFLVASSPARTPDDHGNSPEEATVVSLASGPATYRGSIDYIGDVDVFRVNVEREGTLVVRSSGGMDTVGLLLDANGERITSNDDAETRALDFGLTRRVSPGAYYVSVQRWESEGTGPYGVSFQWLSDTDNYTDLWWNAAESGWGISLSHQGAKLFGVLYSYARDGHPEWYVMSSGDRQADGSFEGALYRTTGPVFSASPWGPFLTSEVGRMRITFASSGQAQLVYSVDGTSVRKSIERQPFGTAPTCSWSAFDRSYATNFQDLWWNATEPGWGIHVAHKGNIIFGTLFTYDATGRATWFAMSSGNRVGTSSTFRGDLYRVRGPAFDSNPWQAVAVTRVGDMEFRASSGNEAALVYDVGGVPVTKAIQRQVFGTLLTQCVPGG